MFKTLSSLATLIAAVSLVNLANSTMTTIMPLRMLEDDASTAAVAIFGAAYFMGFTLGCFSHPPVIQRIGYIRAFAAAAGVCTVLAVMMDRSDSIALWIVLRFLMGLAIAAIFAAVDGWINGTATDSIRATVFSTYGWCFGASAVLGQFVLMRFDGMEPGFITALALAFNVGLILVAMTRTPAPAAHDEESDEDAPGPSRLLTFTSGVSVATAVYAGLVTTAVLATLPAVLAEGGIDDASIGAVIGTFFLGRLLLQIPLGVIADRMDIRLLVAIIATLTGVTALIGALLVMLDAAQISPGVGRGSRLTFLAIMLVLGGLVLPLYTLANSLAFARANGRPAVKIATSLLLVNSAGSVAGPLLVAALMPVLGTNALAVVIVAASAVMVGFAVQALGQRDAPHTPSVGLSDIPTTSVELNSSMAEVKFAEPASDSSTKDKT